MNDRDPSIWFREVRPGKWVPINARGYAAIIVPILALLAVTLVPPMIVKNTTFAIFWLIGCLVIAMPLCLTVIFALARKHTHSA